MKKKLLPLLAAILVLCLLAGCGSAMYKEEAAYDDYSTSTSNSVSMAGYDMSNSYAYAEEGAAVYDTADYYVDDYDYDYDYDDAYYYDEVDPEAEVAEAQQNSGASNEQKLIYTASLSVESLDYDTAVSELAALTQQLGGYYEYSSQGTYGSGCRYMYVTIRVPVENYRTFLDQAGDLFHVLSSSEYTEDVSEAYYDVAGRLETQQTKLTRLQELLLQAEDMEDIIAIESEISYTEEIIDSYTGQLRHYDALVDYSTVTISLDEVYEQSPDPDPEPTFGSRMLTALSGGIHGLVSGIQGILIVLAYIWPWLLIIAVIVAVIVIIRRRTRTRREARRSEKRARKAAKRAAKKARKNPTIPASEIPENAQTPEAAPAEK